MELDQLFEGFDRQTQLDLKVNFKKFFTAGSLEPKSAGLVALACAETVNCLPLIEFCEAFLKQNDASDDEISEAKDISAVMGIANNYYRFRHWMEKPEYQKPAGFRMSLMGRPVVGKHNLELASLAVSIINGCEKCVVGHEAAVIEAGGSTDQVHDVARLASTINGLAVSFRQNART